MPLVLVLMLAARVLAQDAPDVLTALDHALATADRALQMGNEALAEKTYETIAASGDQLLQTLPATPPDARRHVTVTTTVACFNLGVLHVKRQQYEAAARWLGRAATLTPDYPNVQFALGTAWFNGGAFGKAIPPLTRALEAEPANAAARRMLGLALFMNESYDEAAKLLRDDPQRDTDPALQYAYGVALVRSDHAAEAEAVFSTLLQAHHDNAPLNVVLGMAYAEQGDRDAAIQALKRALAIDPTVRGANATLGLLYFKVGQLPEAETALRQELTAHPDDVHSAHLLATVLDLDGKRDEAVTLLRRVLALRPDHLNAHYLLGKILLAQGQPSEAVDQLETASRLAPDAANVHYQLAQAYTKAGRADDAAREFDVYRQLKDTQRERGR